MTKAYGDTKCCECDQNLEGKVQVFDKGKVFCEVCNIRVNKLEEVPNKK